MKQVLNWFCWQRLRRRFVWIWSLLWSKKTLLIGLIEAKGLLILFSRTLVHLLHLSVLFFRFPFLNFTTFHWIYNYYFSATILLCLDTFSEIAIWTLSHTWATVLAISRKSSLSHFPLFYSPFLLWVLCISYLRRKKRNS